MDVESEFSKILSEHLDRYALMQPQDCAKLAYQSEFGPEHMVTDEKAVLNYLIEEWHELSEADPSVKPENIGNGLCRFHLTNEYIPEEAAPLLAKLFMKTAVGHKGSREGLESRLWEIENRNLPGGDEWIEKYRAGGCPPVHHSTVFHDTYQPRYRLIKKKYAQIFSLLLQIYRLMQEKENVVVAIDGRCGSGKTSIAAVISEVFDCETVHMDDFYLPFSQRKTDWEEKPAGNMDLQRFYDEVLLPLSEGKMFDYIAFDCQLQTMKEAVRISPGKLTIVEGSYSHHPMFYEKYDLKIFITCEHDEQVRRLKEREGDYFKEFAARWMPFEERYYQAFGIQEKPETVILNTDNFEN